MCRKSSLIGRLEWQKHLLKPLSLACAAEDRCEIRCPLVPARNLSRDGPAHPSGERLAHGFHKAVAGNDGGRVSELPESRHRGRDSRPPDCEALVGLDRVEALGELVD